MIPWARSGCNKRTEFRVTVRAAAESGEINPESGTINGGIKPKSGKTSGKINPESGKIKPKSGKRKSKSSQVPEVVAYQPETLDRAILEIIRANSGVKREKIFLQVGTSFRSVDRSLKRLRDAEQIEYRGSKRTGGWFVRT